MIIKNQSLLIAFNTDNQTVAGAIVTQDVYDDAGLPLTTRTKPLGEVELAETLASIDAALLAERNDLATQLATITEERDELQAKLDELNPPHDPRYISPDAWFGRMSLDNVARLFSLSEQQTQAGVIAKQFIGAFTVVKAEGRPMWLDHPEAQAGVAFLVTQGVFSPEDAAKMLADSREDEQ